MSLSFNQIFKEIELYLTYVLQFTLFSKKLIYTCVWYFQIRLCRIYKILSRRILKTFINCGCYYVFYVEDNILLYIFVDKTYTYFLRSFRKLSIRHESVTYFLCTIIYHSSTDPPRASLFWWKFVVVTEENFKMESRSISKHYEYSPRFTSRRTWSRKPVSFSQLKVQDMKNASSDFFNPVYFYKETKSDI